MIISASRRTDIPAYYSDWMLNRLKERSVCVRNPMNAGQVRIISLDPDHVDCIVFWSKNPQPMLDKLRFMDDYPYYFQFTLNPYDTDIEPGLPPKTGIIETFKKLSDITGPHRVIWRYDPVLLNSRYTVPYHIDKFNELAAALKGRTKKVIFSFIDFYKKISGNIAANGITGITENEKNVLAENFSKSAALNDLLIDACAEDIDLSRFNIGRARCIDGELIGHISGREITVGKDKNQRRECGCAASVDIGAYNTCPHSCVYCYANYSRAAVQGNCGKHDPMSPVLTSQ